MSMESLDILEGCSALPCVSCQLKIYGVRDNHVKELEAKTHSESLTDDMTVFKYARFKDIQEPTEVDVITYPRRVSYIQ